MRRAALAQLHAPDSVLLLEWSAHPARENQDRDGWREASPYWDDPGTPVHGQGMERVTSSEESWRCTMVELWPSASRLSLSDEKTWARLEVAGLACPDSRPLVLALDAISGGGATLVHGWTDDDGNVAVKANHHLSMLKALTLAHDLATAHPGSRLLLGASLDAMVDRAAFPGEVALAGVRETRQATHLFQGMVAEGKIRHDGDATLAGQVTGASVVVTDVGPIMSGTRSPVPVDAVRGSLWVVWSLVTQVSSEPRIY